MVTLVACGTKLEKLHGVPLPMQIMFPILMGKCIQRGGAPDQWSVQSNLNSVPLNEV